MCVGCQAKDGLIAQLEARLQDQDVMMRGLIAMAKKLVEDTTGESATVILALPAEEPVVGMADTLPSGLAAKLR